MRKKADNFKHTSNLKKYSKMNISSLKEELEIKNLSREEIESKHGLNGIILEKFKHFNKLIFCFFEPLNIFLMIIGIAEIVVYFLEGKQVTDLISFILVFAMVILVVLIDYLQDLRSFKINIKLHSDIINEQTILNIKEFDAYKIDNVYLKNNSSLILEDKITIGDYIYFNAGDVIPADCKIVWSENLFIDESTLTGENDLVGKDEKYIETISDIEINNILYSQTTIMRGSCIGFVIAISKDTYANSILKLSIEEKKESDFDKGMKKIIKIILLLIFSMFPILLICIGLKTGNWINAGILSLSTIVVLVPESLPAILSSNLQIGSRKLFKNKVIVKNFNVIQNLGSVNVLATDKTGTLTDGEVEMDFFLDFEENKSKWLEKIICINAFFQSNSKNAIDKSIMKYIDENKIILNDIELIQEKEFDFEKRILSVKIKIDDKSLIITKGSYNEMFEIISHVRIDNKIEKLSNDKKQIIWNKINDLSNDGYRILIIATKEINIDESIDNINMVYEGLICFEDKIKENVNEAINLIYKNNIELKILTGDSVEISRAIAKKINFKEINIVNGYDMGSTIDINANIYSKLTPFQKGEIISELQNKNNVTAFLGDGVNDALALSRADVGISVNNATSIAKKSSDAIMLEKDLKILEEGFILGRRIFTNAIKFIKITLASNMGLLFTLLISSIIFNFNAMLSVQLLVQNMIYDVSNLLYVFDKVDDNLIKKPQKWNIKSFIPFAFIIGLIYTIISVANFLIIGFGMNYFNDINTNINNDYKISSFQTMFFLESFITHMFLILVLRSEKISFIQSNADYKVLIGTIFLFLIALFLVYTPKVNGLFSFSPPPKIWWLYMMGLVCFSWCIGETTKMIYKKTIKTWF